MREARNKKGKVEGERGRGKEGELRAKDKKEKVEGDG